jgi:hypothetical protein
LGVNARSGRLSREKRAGEEGRFGPYSVSGILRKELDLSERNSVGQKAKKRRSRRWAESTIEIKIVGR